MRPLQTIGLTVLLLTTLTATAAAGPIISPAGIDGNGQRQKELSSGPWADIGYHQREGLGVTSVTPGQRLRLSNKLELEAILPFSILRMDDDTSVAFGNFTGGLHYVHTDALTRARIGARISLPTANDSRRANVTEGIAGAIDGFQHLELWMPDYTTLSIPIHLEYGTGLVALVDAGAQAFVHTGDGPGDHQLFTSVAPGLGAYLGTRVALGLRFPVLVAWTSRADDKTRVSVEPFAKVNIADWVDLSVRFNIPLDKPGTDLNMWGLMLGLGF